MKTNLSAVPRLLLFGLLMALLTIPVVPARAESPIARIEKTRKKIHQRVGGFFINIARGIERIGEDEKEDEPAPKKIPSRKPSARDDEPLYESPSRTRDIPMKSRTSDPEPGLGLQNRPKSSIQNSQPELTETTPEPSISEKPVTPKVNPDSAQVPPAYGRPVPGKTGFAYPPGTTFEPQNMVDVRGFQPGQKVRDPRTGTIFLVP
jgi:hypothetical protein